MLATALEVVFFFVPSHVWRRCYYCCGRPCRHRRIMLPLDKKSASTEGDAPFHNACLFFVVFYFYQSPLAKIYLNL